MGGGGDTAKLLLSGFSASVPLPPRYTQSTGFYILQGIISPVWSRRVSLKRTDVFLNGFRWVWATGRLLVLPVASFWVSSLGLVLK